MTAGLLIATAVLASARRSRNGPTAPSRNETREAAATGTPVDRREAPRERSTVAGGVPADASVRVRLDLGRIAYFKCDGRPQAAGGCPRNERFETNAIRALESVANCFQQAGDFELRYSRNADEITRTVRASRGQSASQETLSAINTCTAPAFSTLELEGHAKRDVVSLTFRVIIR